jgi:hypothetical protein
MAQLLPAASSYWSPPEVETQRIQEAKVCAATSLSDTPQRIVFLIAKSSNRNFSFYEYYETPESFGVRAQWAMLELPRAPSGRAAREDLTATEAFLLGVNVTPRPSGTIHVNFNPEQIRSREAELILDAEGNPALVGTVDGHTCRLQCAYVQMRNNILPDVEYISLYGVGISDGKTYVERLVNEGTQRPPWMP